MQRKIILIRGFTLIELMIVIAIIGFLASIMLLSLDSAREKAKATKATGTMHSLQIALQLYQTTYGDWPSKTGDGRMVITTKAGTGWNTFYNKVAPFMPALTPDITYAESGSQMTQGILYMKGTESQYVQTPMSNSKGGYVGCIKVYDGYYLDEVWSQQSQLTTADGGYDPDGIDHYDGHVELHPEIPIGSCPNTGIII